MKNNMENLKKVENVEQLWRDDRVVFVMSTRGNEREPIVIPYDLDTMAQTVASLPLGSDYGFYIVYREDVGDGKNKYVRDLAFTTFGTYLDRIYFLSTNEDKVPFVQMVAGYQMGEKEIGEIPYMEASLFCESVQKC